MVTDDRPLFFVHVMKTGGTTLKRMIEGEFPPDAVYPNDVEDVRKAVAHTDIAYLLGISEERALRTRLYFGHFPYVAAEMLERPVRVITLLRDPVERVISHLRQLRRKKGGWRKLSQLAEVDDPSFEAVYEDAWLNSRFLLNHQVRMFAMTREDRPKTYMDVVEMDSARFDTARRHLERVECIGLLEEFETFVQDVSATFGLKVHEQPRQNVSAQRHPVSAQLRARIAEDNRMDIEFYEFARQLCRERRAARG